jgi:hypothetical protein
MSAILSIVAIGICTTDQGAISEGRNKPESKAYKYYVIKKRLIVKCV